jgi:uncharacterized protein (TIGR02145 family)
MKQFFLLVATFLFASCVAIERNNPDDPGGNNYTGTIGPSPQIVVGPSVTYEGEIYESVVIGSQTWFKRNLNYAVETSKCGGDDGKLKDENTSYCNTYGRLYKWVTAMALPSSCSYSNCTSQVGTKYKGICPDGWHIPSAAEWMTLTNIVGSTVAATRLKATSGWNDYNGTDTYGFTALPSGTGTDNFFGSVGYSTAWWSASEEVENTDGEINYAYSWVMGYDSKEVQMSSYIKRRDYASVRCVKD